MAKHTISPRARLDLFELWEYISRDNIAAADRLVARIKAAIIQLADMPGMGHIRADLCDDTLRAWQVRPYMIIYRPNADGIDVFRIVHGARDFWAIFGKD